MSKPYLPPYRLVCCVMIGTLLAMFAGLMVAVREADTAEPPEREWPLAEGDWTPENCWECWQLGRAVPAISISRDVVFGAHQHLYECYCGHVWAVIEREGRITQAPWLDAADAETARKEAARLSVGRDIRVARYERIGRAAEETRRRERMADEPALPGGVYVKGYPEGERTER